MVERFKGSDSMTFECLMIKCHQTIAGWVTLFGTAMLRMLLDGECIGRWWVGVPAAGFLGITSTMGRMLWRNSFVRFMLGFLDCWRKGCCNDAEELVKPCAQSMLWVAG